MVDKVNQEGFHTLTCDRNLLTQKTSSVEMLRFQKKDCPSNMLLSKQKLISGDSRLSTTQKESGDISTAKNPIVRI